MSLGFVLYLAAVLTARVGLVIYFLRGQICRDKWFYRLLILRHFWIMGQGESEQCVFGVKQIHPCRANSWHGGFRHFNQFCRLFSGHFIYHLNLCQLYGDNVAAYRPIIGLNVVLLIIIFTAERVISSILKLEVLILKVFPYLVRSNPS